MLGRSFIAVVGGSTSLHPGVALPVSSPCRTYMQTCASLVSVLCSGLGHGGSEARGLSLREHVCISSCHLYTDAGCKPVFDCCSYYAWSPPWLSSYSCWLWGRRGQWGEGCSSGCHMWQRPSAQGKESASQICQVLIPSTEVAQAEPCCSARPLCGFELTGRSFSTCCFWLELHCSCASPQMCIPSDVHPLSLAARVASPSYSFSAPQAALCTRASHCSPARPFTKLTVSQ